MSSLTAEECQQYQRHLSLNGFGPSAQEALKKTSVLVVGAGGLGCPALQYLAAAGVGKIGVVDDDLVELSNLQRQILFTHEDIGYSKAERAVSRLAKMNPLIELIAHPVRLKRENVQSLFQDYQLVVDGSDNFYTRYLVNDACVLYDKVLVHGSIHNFEGMISVFNFRGGPTYRCLFPEEPDSSSIPNCSETGVLGVLPGIIGGWMAMEVIKVTTGVGKPLSGRLLIYDVLTQKFRDLCLQPLKQSRKITELPTESNHCSAFLSNMPATMEITEISEEQLKEMLASSSPPGSLDVREDWERALTQIEPSHHLPLGQIAQFEKLFDLKKEAPLVVYCKAGVRSRFACEELKKEGFTRLFNLSGGMDGWIAKYPEDLSNGLQ